MKRTIIAAALAATLLMTACSSGKGEETKASAEGTTEVTAEPAPVKLDMTIDQVTDSLFAKNGIQVFEDDKDSAWVYKDPMYDYGGQFKVEYNVSASTFTIHLTNNEHNITLRMDFPEGVIDRRSYSNSDSAGTARTYSHGVVVYEMDPDSDFYKNLKVGDDIVYKYSVSDLSDPDSNSSKDYSLRVSAINKQYVLCISEVYGKYVASSSGSNEWPEDSNNISAPFTNKELQAIYDSFVALS